MVYKSINGLALECLSNLFTNRDSVTSNSLRDTDNKLAIPQPHTNYIKIALAGRGGGCNAVAGADLGGGCRGCTPPPPLR